MKKLVMIIFLLSMVLAQEAPACLSDPDRSRLYPAGQSRYGDWVWVFGFIGNQHELRYNIWFGTLNPTGPITVPIRPITRLFPFGQPSNNYPEFMFQEVMMGKMTVTEEFGREFIYQFSSLSGLSFEEANLLFIVRGPKSGSGTITLLADGTEIFASERSRRRMQYQINLVEVAPESLQDGELVLKFLAPESVYFIPHIALTLRAKEPGVMHTSIPASLWLFGSGLGIFGAIKLIKKF